MTNKEWRNNIFDLKLYLNDEKRTLLHQFIFNENEELLNIILNQNFKINNCDIYTHDIVSQYLQNLTTNLITLIREDSILSQYLNDGCYCQIDLNPVVSKSLANDTLSIRPKEKAIFVNVLEYCNFLSKSIEIISSYGRKKIFYKVNDKIKNVLESLIESDECNIKLEDLQQNLLRIVNNLKDMFLVVARDCLVFNIEEKALQILEWLENKEKHSLAERFGVEPNQLYDKFKDNFADVEQNFPNTLAWLMHKDGKNEDMLSNKSTNDTREYKKSFFVYKYIDLLQQCCDIFDDHAAVENAKLPEILFGLDKDTWINLCWRYVQIRYMCNLTTKESLTQKKFTKFYPEKEYGPTKFIEVLERIYGKIDRNKNDNPVQSKLFQYCMDNFDIENKTITFNSLNDDGSYEITIENAKTDLSIEQLSDDFCNVFCRFICHNFRVNKIILNLAFSNINIILKK